MKTNETKKIGVAQLLFLVLKALAHVAAWALVLGVPLFGMWVGSSLAVYWNAPIEGAFAASALAFPALPLLWEGWASWRRRKKADSSKRMLSFLDRMIARTFVLNFLFVGAFLALWPQPVFEAVATRGDWMLDGRTDETSESIRGALLGTADKLSWLYEWTAENEWADVETEEVDDPTPSSEDRAPAIDRDRGDEPSNANEGPHARIARTRNGRAPAWPLPDELHPIVRTIPPAEEASLESVGRYIAAHESDPFMRVKALHDYVTDRIAYDAEGLEAGYYPNQDPQSVFRDRKGVCAGYARLMVALGEVTGDHIVYVVGHALDRETLSVSGIGHAWNAVEIEGAWYLIDATWDAGSVSGPTFTKHYRVDYLLTPSNVFGADHFPDEPQWQLREQPIGRAEFARQPMLRPAFYARGYTLRSPNRAHVSSGRHFVVNLHNRHDRSVLASFLPHGQQGQGRHCAVSGRGEEVRVDCDLPGDGSYDVTLFDAAHGGDMHWDVGRFQVVVDR